MKPGPRFLAAALAAVGATATMGQWGIQATILHYEPNTFRQSWHWTAGVVHDPSPRTTIALEFVGHLNLSHDPDLNGSNSYGGYQVNYAIKKKTFGLQYRSSYFLTGEHEGLYMGPSIGFRRLGRTVEPEAYSTGWSTDTPTWNRPRSEVVTLVPIALRVGYRSMMDDWFMDFYLALGSNLGGGNDPLDAPYLEEKDKLRPLMLQLGYALGMGW